MTACPPSRCAFICNSYIGGGTDAVPGRDRAPSVPHDSSTKCLACCGAPPSRGGRHMAWNIFGRDTTPEQLPAELRAILAEMKRERVAFENLTTAARESGQNLSQTLQPLTEAQKVIAELQTR